MQFLRITTFALFRPGTGLFPIAKPNVFFVFAFLLFLIFDSNIEFNCAWSHNSFVCGASYDVRSTLVRSYALSDELFFVQNPDNFSRFLRWKFTARGAPYSLDREHHWLWPMAQNVLAVQSHPHSYMILARSCLLMVVCMRICLHRNRSGRSKLKSICSGVAARRPTSNEPKPIILFTVRRTKPQFVFHVNKFRTN